MDPLEAALASSFTAPNIPPASTGNSSASSSDQNPPKEAAERRHNLTRSVELEAERLAAMDESWKEAYDERLNAWKAENALRREHSERTRAEYESRRDTTTPGHDAIVSNVGGSFVDARDLVTGEGEGGHGEHALDQVLSPAAKPNTAKGTASGHGSGEDTSQGWENVPSGSLASSYPSINFPPTEPSTAIGHPSHTHTGADISSSHATRRAGAATLALPPIAPPSVTLSIFDSSLSRRARLLALASSLAINLVLPFINGVMLGFGEIAAKSLFGWTGWGNVAARLGIRGNQNAAGRRQLANKGKETPTVFTLP